MIPVSLYIHTPWCVKKCPYCDFNSHAARETIPEQAYLTALLTDLREKAGELQQRPLHSIFIGGGTPSLLSATFYEKLLQEIRNSCELRPDTEITLEANPGTAEQQRFMAYRQSGINRLSLGIQSLNDYSLKRLGRIHNAEESIAAVNMAKQAGFHNINLDLMFALPQQNIRQAIDDLRQLIALSPQHISWYQLTLEPNTLFYHTPPRLPNEDVIAEIYQKGIELLQNNHYTAYEISAYSQPQKQCQHNLNYWNFGDYIGIGAGAHGKITNLETYHIERYWNHKHPHNYLNNESSYIGNRKPVTKNELALEYFMNRMRLKRPIHDHEITQYTRLTMNDIKQPLQEAATLGLLTYDEKKITVESKGYLYLNELLQIFLPISQP